MFFHAGLEFEAGAEEAALGGGNGDAETVRDGLHGHAFDVTKNEDIAEKRRHAVHFAMENFGDLAAAEFLFGGLAGIAEFKGPDLFTDLGVVNIVELGAALLAEAHEALIHHDPGEPS